MAEQLGSAFGAEAPAHHVSAVGHADIFADLAGELEALGPEDRVDRRVPGSQVLAIPAPAGAHDDRRLIEFESDCAAEAAAGDGSGHGCSPFGKNPGRDTSKLDMHAQVRDWRAMRAFFITATGTDIGKTYL